MKVKYPNPTINSSTTNETSKKQEINHHNVFKSQGMVFENALNISNDYYRKLDKAIIYKKPTPVQIVKVDYPKRSSAKIIEAYYQTPSTTDYNGIYKGKYIDYEAKETVKNYFPFKHIFPHQVEHLKSINQLGGIAFIIIYYRSFNDVIIIKITDFLKLYNSCERQSITYEKAKEIGCSVKIGYAPPLDYLKAVDTLFKDNLL